MVWKARDRDSGMVGMMSEWWWKSRCGGGRTNHWPLTGVGVDSGKGVCLCGEDDNGVQ